MLAPSTLPKRYREWNDTHGAPFGRPILKKRLLDYLLPAKISSFTVNSILLTPGKYLIGQYPGLVQCIVLRKALT